MIYLIIRTRSYSPYGEWRYEADDDVVYASSDKQKARQLCDELDTKEKAERAAYERDTRDAYQYDPEMAEAMIDERGSSYFKVVGMELDRFYQSGVIGICGIF